MLLVVLLYWNLQLGNCWHLWKSIWHTCLFFILVSISAKKIKNGWQAWKWHWACYLLIKPWIGAQKGCQACLLQSPKTQECLFCVRGLHWANLFQSLLVTGWILTGQAALNCVFKVSLMSASVHLIPYEDDKICHGPFEFLLLQESAGSTQLFIPTHTFALDPIMLP